MVEALLVPILPAPLFSIVCLAHHMGVCVLWMANICLAYMSIHVCGIRVQQDYSETHEGCLSFDEDANR